MKLGLLGTGLMGSPMAGRLLNAGHQVMVYNRTKEKTLILKEAGAVVADSPGEVILASECIFTMLSDFEATRSALLDESGGQDFTARTIVQMGTISPAQSEILKQTVEAKYGIYFESPVLGSIPEAKSGKLILMVGSTPDQFEQWNELLTAFGPQPLYVGEVGKAAALKLAMNQLIAGLTVTFSHSLAYIRQSGVDVEKFMTITRNSALYAPTFDKKLSRMLDGNFSNPNFPAKHLEKDMRLFLDEAMSRGIDTRIVEATAQVLAETIKMGLADMDYSSVYDAIADRMGASMRSI